MRRIDKTIMAAAGLAALMAFNTVEVRAQDQNPGEPPAGAAAPAEQAAPKDPSTVVAKIGSATVTEGDLALAEMDFAQELAQIPNDRRRSVLIDVLVDMELLAEAAREAGLDETPDFEKRVEFLRTRALRNAYVEQEIVNGISDEALQAEYEKQVASYEPQEEIRARHILVDTKEQADQIIADLKEGGSFEELAKQSKDGTAQNGGDLGYFRKGQMVAPFENAAFALEPGAVTEEPVETQFGFHVIKLEEKRMSQAPTLTEVEDQLRNVLLRQKFEQVMADLREKYPVEITGADAEAPANAAPAEGTPAETPTNDAPAADGEAPAGSTGAEQN